MQQFLEYSKVLHFPGVAKGNYGEAEIQRWRLWCVLRYYTALRTSLQPPRLRHLLEVLPRDQGNLMRESCPKFGSKAFFVKKGLFIS